jgi:hypothetical protein
VLTVRRGIHNQKHGIYDNKICKEQCKDLDVPPSCLNNNVKVFDMSRIRMDDRVVSVSSVKLHYRYIQEVVAIIEQRGGGGLLFWDVGIWTDESRV